MNRSKLKLSAFFIDHTRVRTRSAYTHLFDIFKYNLTF